MASFLFNTGLSRLSKFYSKNEAAGVTYTKIGLGHPNLPRKLESFLGRNAYDDLTLEKKYNLEDISKFADIWPLLKGDAEARKKEQDKMDESGISVPGQPVIAIFYSKILSANKEDKNNHHLTHNLECLHRCGVLIDDLKIPLNGEVIKRYDAKSAFSSFVLNDEEAKGRLGTISKDSKRENLLFLLKEINDLNAPEATRDALLQGLNENLNKKDSIKELLKLLLDAPEKQTGLVAETFSELLKLQDTKAALLEYVRENYKPDENLAYNNFILKQLYLKHKSCFNVAIATFLADGNPVPIDLLIPQAHFGNFKQVFLERNFNKIIDEKWDEILTHRVKQVWPYIVKSGPANNDFSKGRELILKNQLTEIVNSPENPDQAQKTLNFKKLHYVMYESKHPDPARLLVEVLTVDNANDEDINANLAKLLSVLDTEEAPRYHRETIFKALLDPQITSRLFTQNVVLPQFIQLVQKHSNYSKILQQRLLGEEKPKVLHWQLARALTTPHFAQLLDKRSSYSFFGNQQHPADKIAINYPQVIIEHLLAANDADRGELLRVISAKRGIFNARNYLREFSDQQLGILLSYPECMQSNSVVQNCLTSLKLDDDRKIRVNAAKERAQQAKEFMVAHPDFLDFDAETWATHLHLKSPHAKGALKLCIKENFPNNLNEKKRFKKAISELFMGKLQTEAREMAQLAQNEEETEEAQAVRHAYEEVLAAQKAAEEKKRLAPIDLAKHRPTSTEENIFPNEMRNSSSSDSEKQTVDRTSSNGKYYSADPLPTPEIPPQVKHEPSDGDSTTRESEDELLMMTPPSAQQPDKETTDREFSWEDSMLVDTPVTAAPPNKQKTLNPWEDFSTKLDNIQQVFGLSANQTLDKLVSAFKKLQPNIEIVSKPIPLNLDDDSSSSEDSPCESSNDDLLNDSYESGFEVNHSAPRRTKILNADEVLISAHTHKKTIENTQQAHLWKKFQKYFHSFYKDCSSANSTGTQKESLETLYQSFHALLAEAPPLNFDSSNDQTPGRAYL